jgi:hypothetical protein
MPSGQPPGSGSLNEVAEGQRWIIYAILVNVAAIVLRTAVSDVWALLGLVSAGLAIVGVIRLATGLGYSTGIKVLLVILVFIPVVSLITLAILSSRATTALKAGGYKVGLLGAKR